MSATASTTSLGVTIRAVTRRFATGFTAFEKLDLRVSPGEFVALLGPSGCGKSTLLRLMSGLDEPQAGEVAIDHGGDANADARQTRKRWLSRMRGQVAFVFQDAHLLPWRSVRDNVALPLELMGHSREGRDELLRDAIEHVGLAEATDRYPAELSGGMRMRVSLARAMVTQPKLLLLDEPFAALDEITRHQLDRQLRELWQARGMTVVFVTHSTTEAAYLAERAVVMGRRPGRIVADVSIDLGTHRPQEIRATPAFARQTQVLFDALVRGGAMT